MSMLRFVLCAAAFAVMPASVMAKPMTDKARLRAEAEHACYADVQALCSDAIPDEDKITNCMKGKRAQLSPACGKVFDRGLDG